MSEFAITSSAFADGDQIPEKHSCDGDNVSPPLEWSNLPPDTTSLALIVDDPDAPSGTFVHWLAWGLDPGDSGLGEGEAAPAEGTHGFGDRGYAGPCPPPGHGPHRYFHRLYALDEKLDLPDGASREQLEAALEGHVLATAQLIGTYERR
jgi:Raf kinase inhibitor-like YbhB/YbcL family protein